MDEFNDDKRSQLSQEEEPSISDQLKELYSKKIDEGFQVKDRATAIELRKMGQSELKLGGGWNAHAKKVLQEVLEEKGIVLPDAKLSERIGTLRINVEKLPQDLASEQSIPPVPPQQPHSALPSAEPAPPQQPQIIWDEKKKLDYENTMKSVFGDFLGTVYIKLGIVEGEEPEPPKMTPETFRKEANDFGVKVGDYAYNRRVNLPAWIELLSLASIGFMVFGMPVVNQLFFKMKKNPPDKDLVENESRAKG